LNSRARTSRLPHGRSPAQRAKNTLRALSRAVRTPVPRATLDLVVEALFPEPPFVYAFGLLDPAPPSDSSSAAHIRWRSQRVLGWHVVGIETDPSARRALDRGMRDYNNGPLKTSRTANSFAAPGLPKITRRPAPRVPAGSVVYEMLVPESCSRLRRGWSGAPPRSPHPRSLAVVFAPGKPRSWLVISPVHRFAIAKMRELLARSHTARSDLGVLELLHIRRSRQRGSFRNA
jgi:hypothetical protein